MTIKQINHWLKRMLSAVILVSLVIIPYMQVFAFDRDGAISRMKSHLQELGWDSGDAQDYAETEVDNTIQMMEGSQAEIDDTYDALEERVNAINFNDPKKQDALNELNTAYSKVQDFKGYDPDSHLDVVSYIGGTLPQVVADDTFSGAEEKALEAMYAVNRVLIAPTRPGDVPEGDILEAFVPQVVRLLFQFASIAILIAFITSGIYLVISFDNEERVTKAKNMIYYSLIGFAFVLFAFAIVKAVTDIDFFRFI
ncbi:pilin [Patescibacteria group bacterium]|nr:pilin [Patescibacteria group bacterium]MBU1935315.1 pilin [Patescibacteria group bacterium]